MADLAAEIQAYLYEQIPLSQAMGLVVEEVNGDGVRLWAPLEPNINHRNTVFGGSAAALAILAGWTLVYHRLRALTFRTRVVIQRNTVEYLAPIRSDFRAVCVAPEDSTWQHMFETLKRKGKGRISLDVELVSNGMRVGTFTGSYVALRTEEA